MPKLVLFLSGVPPCKFTKCTIKQDTENHLPKIVDLKSTKTFFFLFPAHSIYKSAFSFSQVCNMVTIKKEQSYTFAVCKSSIM